MKEQTFILQRAVERNLSRLVSALSSLPKDTAWRVTIKEYKRTRSHDQNAYLWGVVYPSILKHLPGWDADDLHEYCLGEWSGWETLEGFGRKRLKPVRRSSRLSTTEFSDYVGHIQRTMAEKGIYIPDPNEEANEVAA
jgi:truncated hemoglobin YjbI